MKFHLNSRDLSMVTGNWDFIDAQGEYTLSVGGGQPATGAPSASGTFDIDGQVALPE